MNKKIIISLSLIAILFFDLIPFVLAPGGGGTHVLQELPPTIIYQDDGVGYVKVKRTPPGQLPAASDPAAVAYEARSLDTKQGVNSVIISGSNVKAPTVDATSLVTKTLQSEYWSVAPSFYTKSLVLWDADSSGGIYKTIIEDPNPYSRTGFRIDTQGGTVSSGTVSSNSVIAGYISTGTTGVTINGKDVTVPSGGGVTLGGVRKSGWDKFSTPGLDEVTAVRKVTTDAITTGGLTANGALTVTGTTTLAGLSASSASISGNYLYVNAENAGRLRVGATWGIPGLYSGDDGAKDLVLGVPSGNKVNIGTSGNFMVVQGNGNVGIGTTSPGTKLEVTGTVRATNYNVASSGKGVELYYHPANDAGYLIAYDRSSNVFKPLYLYGNPVRLEGNDNNNYIGGYIYKTTSFYSNEWQKNCGSDSQRKFTLSGNQRFPNKLLGAYVIGTDPIPLTANTDQGTDEFRRPSAVITSQASQNLWIADNFGGGGCGYGYKGTVYVLLVGN